uniref:Piwi domain-containing protein n=1 Tax=Strongyloides stercoralis TaxID=6248 RepID=A0A0K0EPK4_STRER
MANTKTLATQTYVINVGKKSKAFRYLVSIEVLSRKTSQSWKISNIAEKKLLPIAKLEIIQACKSIIRFAFEKSDGFNTKDIHYVYDGASDLISSKELSKYEVVLSPQEVPLDTKVISRGRSVKITLTPQTKYFEIDIGNVEGIIRLPMNDEEKSIIYRFFENLVISPFMVPFKNDDEGYISQLGSGKNFIRIKANEDNSQNCGDGRCTVPGITRSLIELNVDNQPAIALSVDYSENIYYKPGNLATILQEVAKTSNITYSVLKNTLNEQNILGVYLKTTHRKNGDIFKFQNTFTTESANNKIIAIKKDGSESSVSVAKYFEERYQTKLQYPDWPLFIKKVKKVTFVNGEKQTSELETYYPIEVLEIMPGQCVPVPKLDRLSAQTQQRINTGGPYIRKANTIHELTKMGIFKDNITLFKSFGVSIHDKSSFFKTENLSEILYTADSSRPITVDKGKISSKGANVYSSTKLRKQLYIASCDVNDSVIRSFERKYIEVCEKNGIQFSGSTTFHNIRSNFNTVDKSPEVFASEMNRIIKDHNNSFLIYIDPKNFKSHLALKYYEQKFGVLTQHITFEVVRSLPTKTDSMKNVINKTNAKLGGLNYKIDLSGDLAFYNVDSKNVLYIGFNLNTSSIGVITADATINVGSWAANVSKNLGQFLADYWYQPRDDSLLLNNDQIKSQLEKIFNKWKKNVTSKPPKKIIVYRTGLSQQSFQKSNDEEVDYFKTCIDDLSSKIFKIPTIPHSWIYVNRSSNLRLYEFDDRDAIKNIDAGTYVYEDISVLGNNKIVGKSYANCLGTAKLPLYTLGSDTNTQRLTTKDIMNITNMLCYKYDIIPLAVSLPAVSYIAVETSKRGTNNLVAIKNDRTFSYTQDEEDITNKNEILSYTNSRLNDVRFNA